MNDSKATKLEKIQGWKLPMGAMSCVLSDDETTMIAGCMDGVYRFDLANGKEERLYQHESYVSSVARISDHRVVSAGYDGRILWFDLKENKLIRDIRAHEFWSWDMCLSPDHTKIASVTGQYLAGSYRYEPQPEREPSIKVFAADSGELIHALSHVPSTQAVSISPDNRLLAAGNIMGEIRIFDLENGQMIANWTTPDFTSWGIIKSHCYLGGVFAMQFTPNGKELLLCGMGPMRDPMAGNGKQLWQRWDFLATTPKMTDQTHKGDGGEGLMETLATHSEAGHFAMGGRLRGGDWNLALFDSKSGDRIAFAKTGFRITQAVFMNNGKRLLIVGTQGQPKDRNDSGSFPKFGRVETYEIT
ncbi:MAG: hypothetical protein AAGG48_18555 [Planctomycetota bacterium]